MILDEMGPEKCESVRQQIPVKKFCTPEEVSFRPLTQDPALLYDQLTVQGSRCVNAHRWHMWQTSWSAHWLGLSQARLLTKMAASKWTSCSS